MLTIKKTAEGEKVTLFLEGRLDVSSAPQLEDELKRSLERSQVRISELIFDLQGLGYVSSAGLRVLLLAQRRMNRQGRMRLINVGEAVMETLEITGFTDIFFVSR